MGERFDSGSSAHVCRVRDMRGLERSKSGSQEIRMSQYGTVHSSVKAESIMLHVGTVRGGALYTLGVRNLTHDYLCSLQLLLSLIRTGL